MEYKEFLEKKRRTFEDSGFEINESKLNPALFDFQRFIVKLALKKGRFAVFSDTGTGKTIMQLEWAKQVSEHTSAPVLILAPLAVSGQTIQEGIKFGIEVQKLKSDVFGKGIFITNYEQLDNINCSQFGGVVLDESSILKNFEGKYRTKIIDEFSHTKYKLACTATPSPNDPMELGNHSEFLNIMGRTEMLSVYFIHDGGETAKWRLKKHSTKIFWEWVSSWSIMLMKPQDIGFTQQGYDLPELRLIEKQISTPDRDNGKLFNDIAVNATNFNQELRNTLEQRMNEVLKIINNSDENWIIWVKQNAEGDYLKKLIPNAVEVKGSDKPEYKEKMLLGFAKNEFKVLITKSKIAQFGLNYQNCNNQVFAGLDFSFESLYQSIRRSYRFGQTKPVNIYLITTDTMQNVIKAIDDKKKQFETMQSEMTKAVNKTLYKHVEKIKPKKQNKVIEDNYTLIQGDAIEEIKNVNTNSIGLIIYSPPFAELYTYSDNFEDMGNSKNYNEFFRHFKYLIPELNRILKPGRIMAVHCMDLPIQKGKEGYIGLRDFSGGLIKLMNENNFIYHSRVTIWKDPVIEMQRTKALGLLHKQLKKDASMCRVGLPDYVLFFRKEGENLEPIKNDMIPVEIWQKYASPIWLDINYSRTLNYRIAKDEKDEKHICPLQLDTIERIITLYSNEGDIIFSPFAGIGSEGYQAVEMNRKAYMIELKHSYFKVMEKNLKNITLQKNQKTLFHELNTKESD